MEPGSEQEQPPAVDDHDAYPPISPPPPLETGAAPYTPPTSTGLCCIACSYDLSGQTLAGMCPECGAPVMRSIHVAKLPTSGKGIASMVVGICAVILGCPSYGLLWVLLGVPAVILSHMSRADIRAGRADRSSHGMAIAGLVLGWTSIGLGAAVVSFLMWIWIAMGGF